MLSDIRALAGFGAGIIAIAAFIPYALSILRGATKPNWISWSIWAVLGAVLFASYWASGATYTLWLALAYCINPLLVCALAFRLSPSRIEPFDWLCVAGALFSLLVWAVWNSAAAGLYCCIAVDACGALPTIRKAYTDPDSEDALAWRLVFSASLINLFAIDAWSPERYVYPLYLVLCTGAIAGTLSLRPFLRFVASRIA